MLDVFDLVFTLSNIYILSRRSWLQWTNLNISVYLPNSSTIKYGCLYIFKDKLLFYNNLELKVLAVQQVEIQVILAPKLAQSDR